MKFSRDTVGLTGSRLLATQLQTDRFYALYLLLFILVVAYAVPGWGSLK